MRDEVRMMYLATETMLIHESRLVELSGRRRPRRPVTYFTDSSE